MGGEGTAGVKPDGFKVDVDYWNNSPDCGATLNAAASSTGASQQTSAPTIFSSSSFHTQANSAPTTTNVGFSGTCQTVKIDGETHHFNAKCDSNGKASAVTFYNYDDADTTCAGPWTSIEATSNECVSFGDSSIKISCDDTSSYSGHTVRGEDSVAAPHATLAIVLTLIVALFH
jgi:hypothetical protein